uniref:Sushi domain-containing protein n=1 Tax=Amazona collaria TaxID=241587 RepID=A0A8B9F872_9PSIT
RPGRGGKAEGAPHCLQQLGSHLNVQHHSMWTVFPVGRTVEYVCRPGYTQHIEMSPAITCLENRTWSAALEFCKRKQCANPRDPENGRAIVLTDLLLGSKVNYTCDKGYKLVGGSQRMCEVSGTRVSWSGDAPVCQRIACGPPPNISHGTHSGHSRDTFSYADVVTYTCDPGHPLAGEPSIICTTADGEHGMWSGPPPRCGGRALGPTPPARPEIKNGRSTGLESMYELMDTVVFECDFGYALKGSQESQCQFGGKWDPPVPTCEKMITCTSPSIQDGEVAEGQSAAYHPGASVTFQCHPGYVLWGSRAAKCQPDGPGLSLTLCLHPSCLSPCPSPLLILFCLLSSVLQCPSPPNIDNGNHNSPDLEVFTAGMVVNYSCDPGYSLLGEASIHCTDSGNWSLPLPQCAGTPQDGSYG